MSQSLKQLWKHSSSLIILGKSAEATKINNFNYKVRHAKEIHRRKCHFVFLFVFALIMDVFGQGSSVGATFKGIVPGGSCISGRSGRTKWPNGRLAQILSQIWHRWFQIQVNYQNMFEAFVHFQPRPQRQYQPVSELSAYMCWRLMFPLFSWTIKNRNWLTSCLFQWYFAANNCNQRDIRRARCFALQK